MKNISFQLTKGQILARTKTVTRRMGWKTLKRGERLRAVEKGMGLKKGEKVKQICMIEVVSVIREPLNCVTYKECVMEGFANLTPPEFIQFFCYSHKGCTPESEVTRIEFRYVD